jgi:SNF2 family DNA or RNA helicase
VKFGIDYDAGVGPRQSYTRAERPIAALAAIAHARVEGRFTGFGVSEAWITNECVKYQLPVTRLAHFARSLAGERLVVSDEEVRGAGLHLPHDLDQYQIDALRGMRAAGGVLAMGCGLGKTVTAIAAAKLAFVAGASSSRCWVVCPLNAVGTWQAALAYLEGVFDEVEIVSMDSAHKCVGLNPAPGGVIIFDEAHMLGDAGARRTRAAHQLRGAFDFGLALTGTLLHAGIGKALSVMDLAVPGLAGFARTDNAAEHFGCLFPQTIDLGNGRTKQVIKIDKPTGESRRRFLEFIAPRVVSMSFESESVRASVDVPQQERYVIRVAAPWPSLDDLAVQYIQEQMEQGFEIPSAQEVAHALCRHQAAAKVEWLMNAMDDPNLQVVVFAVYHETLDLVGAAFETAGVSYVRIDGTVTGQQRIALVEQFQRGEVRVFLGQMDAAGVSINLQNARISVALEHSWKAANFAQCLARTRRRGQTEITHHIDLVANQLQLRVAQRVSDAADFDASLAEYQTIKQILDKHR